MRSVFRGLGLAIFLCCVFAAARGELQINEVLASNGRYEDGHAWEWIELKNTGKESVSLAGLTLRYQRKGETYSYAFPQGARIAAGGWAVVDCIGFDAPPRQGSGYYAAFSLSRKGGTVTLLQGEKTLDSLEMPAQWGNISFGRAGDGAEAAYLPSVTRGGKNPATGYQARTEAPVFSQTGGLCAQGFSLMLTAEPGAEIRYTLDGSEPTERSPRYTAPLALEKTACVRARAFAPGKLPSETAAQSYLFEKSAGVAVVSLVADTRWLFDSKTGILVPGNGKIKNYERDWEYPINVEYYAPDGEQQLNQQATFRVTGATSRRYGQKTISLFARSAYGEKRFAFQPFENRAGYTGYKALTLRAAGTEAFMTRFRDALLTSRAAGLSILYQEAVPVEVYINGEYWGHYNLREKINKHMIAQFEGVEDDEIIEGMTIIKGRGEVTKGSREEWDELIAFLKKKDLSQPENLSWVLERLDADSFFTHAALEMIVGNTDIGNVRYYKLPGGKWKCALYDLDAGMENLKQGPIRYFNKSPRTDSQLFYHEPFAALMRAPEMRARFLELFGQALTRFLPQELEAEVERWADVLAPLMARQIARWPKCSPGSMSVWEYEVRSLRKICRQRPQRALEMLCDVYRVTSAEKQRYFSEFLEAIKE